jgi:hypothetical protein
MTAIVGRDVHNARFIRAGRSVCATCGQRHCGSHEKPIEMVSVLRFDELDREAIRQNSDNATNAGSDGQRRSDLRLHINRDRDAGHRHVDNKAALGRAIGKGQSGVRISRAPCILPGSAALPRPIPNIDHFAEPPLRAKRSN